MPPKLTTRQIEALRALSAGPGGIRYEAYPSVMPTLVEMGLARESVSKTRPRRPIWLITDAGRAVVKEVGTGEPGD
jgi:hypothetical protein